MRRTAIDTFRALAATLLLVAGAAYAEPLDDEMEEVKKTLLTL